MPLHWADLMKVDSSSSYSLTPKLCMDLRVLPNSSRSSGTSIPDIGDFREIPESFFSFQTMELKDTREPVLSLIASNWSDPHVRGTAGNDLTSTELLEYNVVLR